MEAKRYYYVDKTQTPQGPFSIEELDSLATDGVINSSTYVIEEGGEKYFAWKVIAPNHSETQPPEGEFTGSRGFESQRPSSAASSIPNCEFRKSLGSLYKRYRDGYSLSKMCGVIALMLRVCGYIMLAIGAFMSVGIVGGALSGDAFAQLGSAFMLPVALSGVVTGLLIIGASVVVGAVGSILNAQMDTAVNTSPFLQENEKVAFLLRS